MSLLANVWLESALVGVDGYAVFAAVGCDDFIGGNGLCLKMLFFTLDVGRRLLLAIKLTLSLISFLSPNASTTVNHHILPRHVTGCIRA